MAEKIIEFDAMEQAVSLFGSFDENVKMIEGEYDVSIISRGSELKVCGDIENVDKAVRALNSMLMLIKYQVWAAVQFAYLQRVVR